MSKIISFRLSPDNRREAMALDVLSEWKNQGFSIRSTITEALLSLKIKNESSHYAMEDTDLDTSLKLLNRLLTQLTAQKETGVGIVENDEGTVLNSEFTAAIRQTARKGVSFLE